MYLIVPYSLGPLLSGASHYNEFLLEVLNQLKVSLHFCVGILQLLMHCAVFLLQTLFEGKQFSAILLGSPQVTLKV